MDDTIVAVSTPAGRGGVGIVRLSGATSHELIARVSGVTPKPGVMRYTALRDEHGEIIDRGFVVVFRAPASYTGEDMAECQLHGSPPLLEAAVMRFIALGARPAQPGEFTQRAFLNGKLDLAQAEAVADLIASQSLRAARAAGRTLAGAFGNAVTGLIDDIHRARAELEASIDFADDVHASALVAALGPRLAQSVTAIDDLLGRAHHGARLIRGAVLAIVGAPNVGKSSLLNALSERDRAIVTAHPGTTRDSLDVALEINGVPVSLIDTAGLRSTHDEIERAGIARTHEVLGRADLVVLVVDRQIDAAASLLWGALVDDEPPPASLLVVHNKIDLDELTPEVFARDGTEHVTVSAKTGAGIDQLRQQIVSAVGVAETAETEFGARERHLDALRRARSELAACNTDLLARAPELVGEHLRLASDALAAIGGRYSTEDLLGDIFARFCIGK